MTTVYITGLQRTLIETVELQEQLIDNLRRQVHLLELSQNALIHKLQKVQKVSKSRMKRLRKMRKRQ